MSDIQNYDVIVVGAGHAGSEAAAAAANLGSKVLLITMDMTKIAQMSCNPAMGGIAKGQIVREIDALGGYSGIVTDRSSIQFRMLNISKGPAMWSPRAQCDRAQFSLFWREELENISNVHFWQDTVVSLHYEDNRVVGVRTGMGVDFYCKSVVLTAGTFLNGLIHIGRTQLKGGRIGEKASYGITQQLIDMGFRSSRMKTGTPARIDGRSINFDILSEQFGDDKPTGFSYQTKPGYLPKQRSCYMTHTNSEVHEILKTGFVDSPLFNGIIQGVGPRYCPSIEDKVVTFADKDRHLLFLEPEGWNTNEYYINGFSSSLPLEIQYKALRNIRGLEDAVIFRPGYAIEYDFFYPTQLKATLETKLYENLFFAGQINGTTGYEEAAAQGIIAGINAHQRAFHLSEFTLGRHEAYIGVLIDDLITKDVTEPYRMFTSRAEYRILLRQDNADVRLTERSHAIGLASHERVLAAQSKMHIAKKIYDLCESTSAVPDDFNPILELKETPLLDQKTRLSKLLLRPQIGLTDFIEAGYIDKSIFENNINFDEIVLYAEIEAKYAGYIEREKIIADKLFRLENVKLNPDFDYNSLQNLTIEARQKLTKFKPTTIGQALRINGVSPSDVNVLLVYMGR